ncbi:uncharacterized protein DUF1837 [Winogradskyella eximia]|uniref:Uncharacterized protein DUF1837 n=1 Tax=Winogradskyella eximia TaxID=262006 RepID=A0A3D9H732_9FLAO|nr:DUF1837 domain-containing protein [Winogradskyella eximia]RED45282.1 uncharacterized protein DUF1837 [Winogradskyella eximia]
MTKKLDEIDWLKLLKVDPIKFKAWFNLVEEKKVDELTVKFYSLKFTNDKPDYEGFIRYLYNQVESYVFEEIEIKEIREDGDNPQEKALSYFGDIDPISDGSYGELILYLFVEAILQAPLVVHKVSQTYNDNDQVKGSDGIFIGNINDKPTLLIGESKMRNSFNKCVKDALESLSRYINTPEAIERELCVAKKHLSRDLNNLDKETLDLIYKSFRTKQPEFNEYDLCYPAFLMYKEDKINEMLSKKLPDIEKEINTFLSSLKKKRIKYITKSLPKTNDITLEFFMMPVNNVNDFRKLCYDVFHENKV